MMRIAMVGVLLGGVSFAAAPQWKLQYFYDKAGSTLNLTDIRCPAVRTCIAAGYTEDFKREHPKGAVVVTSDGGEHWTLSEVSDLPFSLFFLNDSLGWMVTDKGIWQTTEAGRSWKKLKGLRGIERVWFTDAEHGWAIGHPKAIYRTEDGGKEWTKDASAQLVKTPDQDTAYTTISFVGQAGVIGGDWTSAPAYAVPQWVDPATEKRRQSYTRGTFILLKTQNGGQKWQQFSGESKGFPVRLLMLKPAEALGLFEFPGSDSPSALIRIDLNAGKTAPIFNARESMAFRDIAVLPDGTGILAGIEFQGKSSQLPIPGKLKLATSRDLTTWLDMTVDYRAVAIRPVIAAADSDHVWVATDTGMILKLVR